MFGVYNAIAMEGKNVPYTRYFVKFLTSLKYFFALFSKIHLKSCLRCLFSGREVTKRHFREYSNITQNTSAVRPNRWILADSRTQHRKMRGTSIARVDLSKPPASETYI